MMLVHKVNKKKHFNDQLVFYVSVSHVPKVSSITTKLSVQPQKMVRGFKFQIFDGEELALINYVFAIQLICVYFCI